MFRYLVIFSAFISGGFFLIFPGKDSRIEPQIVKNNYLSKLDTLIREIRYFSQAIDSGDEKKLQYHFCKTRLAYKRIELIIEYYFESYATVLNGPPIPFFEESEPYVLSKEPLGLQVIEGLIFPAYEIKNKPLLKLHLEETLRYAEELYHVNESFEFNESNVFDAVMEEIYRVSSLGITGFDSQTAGNALPECISSLSGILDNISFYQTAFKNKLPGKFEQLQHLFNDAILYLREHRNFNKFNRMEFINRFLNPIAKITGEYKTVNNLTDNASSRYYSAIKKNNTLFNPGAFNPFRFLDDFTSTPQKIEMGRQLFFENQLSSNNKQSCASCHQPNKAFTDGLKTSAALDGHSVLKRNAPTLWNVALQRNLFVDSRSRSLEDQVLQVLNNSQEMHGSANLVADKILNIDKYKEMYKDAYPNAKDEDAVKNICNAIACYERSLIALNSRFDKHMNGVASLNKNEINGFNLFMGKAKCSSCHFMPLFSGTKPPRYYYIESEVLGVPASADKNNPGLDSDSGRYLITQSLLHLFSFKTPTLRNVALTAPYMHNGVFNTLEEVMDFYNNGGGKGLGIAPQNQTLPFEKLNLSKKEKKDIISFMKTLTDTTSLQIISD